MAKYFSSDQHIGELPVRGTPTYYRGVPPEVFEEIFLNNCCKHLKANDELYLVGDLIRELKDLAFYNQLPECNLCIICGNKETRIANFAERAAEILSLHRGGLEIITGVYDVEINGRWWRIAHDPKDLVGYSMPKPSICGHVHRFWGTKKLPNGQPIINVGVDSWGYGLVSEDFLEIQYEHVVTGDFDRFLDLPH